MRAVGSIVFAIASLALASPLGTSLVPHTSLNHAVHVSEGFVSVSNGTFYQHGKPTYLVSMNYWCVEESNGSRYRLARII